MYIHIMPIFKVVPISSSRKTEEDSIYGDIGDYVPAIEKSSKYTHMILFYSEIIQISW